MAKPSPDSTPAPRLLALELWGLGDLALAIPFLRTASAHAQITLVAKPHAAPLLARFAPQVRLVPFVAPWTAFTGKYRLQRWPWRELTRLIRTLRGSRFAIGVSARPDPRDHALLRLAAARRRLGFPRAGSRLLLSGALPSPPRPHRLDHWRALAAACGWPAPADPPLASPRAEPRRIVIHPGAAQPARRWPPERFAELARRLEAGGWRVEVLAEAGLTLEQLLDTLARASRFVGNDSGPGHLAALLGVPTFTVFGPSLPERFSTPHPRAAWIEGAACAYRPCWDACRFAEPHCIRAVTVDAVWSRLEPWLNAG